MSYYYKYNFVSPASIYATVKEELKSYFDTGVIDDLLFPTYLDKCLNKLGKATYVISETTLDIEDFEARLPDNFEAVREAWMCAEVALASQDASSFYSQAGDITSIQISPLTVGGVQCTNTGCTSSNCDGKCMPELIQAVYKTNSTTLTKTPYKKLYLLKPGNISARKNCTVEYTNAWSLKNNTSPISSQSFTPGSSGYDSFDVRDNKFITNFRAGVVHLILYVTAYDEDSNQMVPDNYRIKEFIEAFLKFKMFETLSNQITDETFNQIQQKMIYYKQAADEAYIMADIEIKKQDIWTKQRRVKAVSNRFNMFGIAGTIAQGYRDKRNN